MHAPHLSTTRRLASNICLFTTALTMRLQLLKPLPLGFIQQPAPGLSQAEQQVTQDWLRGMAFKDEMQQVRRHLSVASTILSICFMDQLRAAALALI